MKEKNKNKRGCKSEKAKEGYKKSLRDNLNINSTVPSSGRDNKDIQLRLQRETLCKKEDLYRNYFRD